ncbi:glycoside hydrolase family 51 protein [Athelia psychrophila]|uniref:Glycoside hydrolase family 51 protein n=1 Tax=Athelia psychrophila TaxID=1759441 RepID=A0A166RDR8_9AGAM|nr:glycoside hydrolase family 51 protein [Fibularhizoctonia sp. CBS 109695]
MSKILRTIAAAALLARLAPTCLSQATIVINATPSHSIPSTLCKSFSKAIRFGDGGLYAELLQNRAFQQVDVTNQASALTAWAAVGDTSITVIADTTPLSSALPNALQVTVPTGSTGSVGFSNSGYWGINVNTSWTYEASLYYRFPTATTFSGPLTIALTSSSGVVLASKALTISGKNTGWTQLTTTLTATKAPSNTNNLFTVTVNGATAAGQTIHFAFLSLFPPTYKGRANGMRVDIANAMAALGPSFFRLPGGNNLGQTIPTRWQWNATVGALIDRPGRVGDWGYPNTDGLGLYEYMTFCEDVGMEAIMAIWAGYSLNGASVAQGAALEPYIQQSIDQINFVISTDITSGPGAVRASLGHPKPFALTYIEVGNEDFFSSTYPYRWTQYLGNLTALFPHHNTSKTQTATISASRHPRIPVCFTEFMATSYHANPVSSQVTLLNRASVHVYQTPKKHRFCWFLKLWILGWVFSAAISSECRMTVIAGINVNTSWTYEASLYYRFPTATTFSGPLTIALTSSSGVYDVHVYPPISDCINSLSQTPNLIGFDAGSVIHSTSYYVQHMFSLNRGDVYLPSTLPWANGTLYLVL